MTSSRLKNLIDRLRPDRWRRTPQITPRDRAVLWKQVSAGDPALRATVDMLAEIMEANCNVVMDTKRTSPERLLAADAASFARSTIYAIEDEWQTARKEFEKENTKP